MNMNQQNENASNKYSHNALLGRIGEEIAANYLVSQGFSILDRNWKSKYHYELDIIAFKDNLLHVVEVKTRMDGSLIDPQRAFTIQKLRKLVRGIQLYKKAHRLDFDAVIDGIKIVYRNENDYDLTFLPDLHDNLLTYQFLHRNR